MEGIKRDLFPILDNKTYFNTCSTGPLSTPVKDGIKNFMNQWDEHGGIAWVIENGWNEIVEKSRSIFAKLINARPEEIAYSFGNSVALSSVTSGINFDPKDEIIFNELDFPATATHSMGKSNAGLNYVVVKSQDGKTVDVNNYKNSITTKTKLITACHVVSNTGFKLDIQNLIDVAHTKDIDVFIDGYQSVGCIPIDVKKLDVDYLASGCLKWLLGGFGISFLYIRKDKIDSLNPSSIGWMGVDSPFDDLYDKLRTTLHRPKDAQKFQYGTPYPFGATSAYEGMKIVEQIGIQQIKDQNEKLTQMLIDKAYDYGFSALTPREPDNRGSIVNIQVNNAISIVENLKKKDFILDMRSNGIRVSPHFFNNSLDVEHFFNQLKQLTN